MADFRERAAKDLGLLYIKRLKCQEKLQRSRTEADTMAKQLRAIADCFDKNCDEVKVIRTYSESSFAFSRDNHKAASASQLTMGTKNPVCPIPQNIKETMEEILGLEKELSELEKEFKEKENMAMGRH